MNKKQYEAYVSTINAFIAKHDAISYDGELYEPFFSPYPCICCGSSLGGDRYTHNYLDSEGNIDTVDLCADCMYFVPYGKLDDMTMMEISDDE